MLSLSRSATVFRNPSPLLRSLHAWHPSLVHLGDARWVCSFDLASAPEAHDYRTWTSQSDDDGATWSEPQPLVPEEVHPGSVSLRISRTAGGRLLGYGALLDVRRPDQGFLNASNFGYAPMRLALAESADDGLTWGPPQPLDLPLSGIPFETCHPILELMDGRLLAPTHMWPTWEGETPHGLRAVAFVSDDGGRTWPRLLDVRDDWSAGRTNWEQSIVQLSTGLLVGTTWRYHLEHGDTAPTEFVVGSADTGFVNGGPTGFLGQTTKLVRLADDSVLALYRRHDRPGLWATRAHVSAEPAPTWEEIETVLVWDGADSGMHGTEDRTEQLSGLQFGYPSPVLRTDGSVEVAFWRRVEEINEIALVRLAIDY